MHQKTPARRRIFYASVAAVAATGLLVVGRLTPAPDVVPSVAVSVELPIEQQELLTLESQIRQHGPAVVRDGSPSKAIPIARPKFETYTVVAGDSLGLIAERFELKAKTLEWANDLESGDLIKPGQELIVPSVDGVLHKVRSGDTLSDVASLYAAELDLVVQSNSDINPGLLKPGDLLIVPGGEPGFRRMVASARSGGRPNVRTFDQWPASGPMTDPFGWRVHPVFGTSHYHDGLDIGAPDGSSVRAVANGTVTLASRYGGYGLTVRIDHGGGVVTQYAHLSQSVPVVGDKVNAGQQIGNVGNTGNSTGPHLHFSVYVDGAASDPAAWLP